MLQRGMGSLQIPSNPVGDTTLGDSELPTGVELDRPQMLKDLFRRVPCPGPIEDLPGCDPVYHFPWTRLARAGQWHGGRRTRRNSRMQHSAGSTL